MLGDVDVGSEEGIRYLEEGMYAMIGEGLKGTTGGIRLGRHEKVVLQEGVDGNACPIASAFGPDDDGADFDEGLSELIRIVVLSVVGITNLKGQAIWKCPSASHLRLGRGMRRGYVVGGPDGNYIIVDHLSETKGTRAIVQ